ncbi:hypothetical protein B0H63DRAFT_564022 [Podospora didyma]|uniref:Extracellular membrane protein CFEM domain-containing protein n=1 Tax=Podospora didyma TaxID=330526 RepID=A0AAE0KB28_9PEZI|nr:hypothetical protein B0H63DRAFT_564022 [Podospora didyma]
MPRLSTIALILFCILLRTTRASNPLFVGFNEPMCDSCQDKAFNSCPGQVTTDEFNQCICGGVGADLYVGSCIPLCVDASGFDTSYFAITLLTYCVEYFPTELCGQAQAAGVSPQHLSKYCGSGSQSGGTSATTKAVTSLPGLATKTTSRPAGTGSPTTGGGGSVAATGALGGGTGTGAVNGTNTDGDAPSSSSSKAAAPTNCVSPAWGVMFGLGAYMVNANL